MNKLEKLLINLIPNKKWQKILRKELSKNIIFEKGLKSMEDKYYKYGLISNSSVNIGDEIQSLAASRFIPEINCFIHRERINKYKSEKLTKIIMNAWWTWCPQNFPPSKYIKPLLISMHFNDNIRKSKIKKSYKEYLKKWGPVGCRDKATEKWLIKNGVDAYFSGCLTLTLQKNENVKKKNYILATDISDKMLNEIKKRTNRPVYNISRCLLPMLTSRRLKLAKAMLNIYQGAHCVVTYRVHTAMPCLALETPVLMIKPKEGWPEDGGRFEELAELCNTIDEEDFLSNPNIYNFEAPPQNPDNYLALREKLIKKCVEFTNFDSLESPVMDDENIQVELMDLFKYEYHLIKVIFYWIKKIDLFKTWFRLTFLHRTKYDLKPEKPRKIL